MTCLIAKRTAASPNEICHQLIREFRDEKCQLTTGLDTRFLTHEISTGKRRRGAFETDLASYRYWLRHLTKGIGTSSGARASSQPDTINSAAFAKRPVPHSTI